MRLEQAHGPQKERPFVRMCKSLASLDSRISSGALGRLSRRLSGLPGRSARGHPEVSPRRKRLEADLNRAGMHLDSQTVSSAAQGFAIVAALVPLTTAAVFLASDDHELAVISAFMCFVAPALARELVCVYPSMIASRRASLVSRSSTDEVNIMIMSIRHEASLPKAMAAAARRDSEFAAELRECIWSVIAGTHSTFEDALHSLAVKWSDRCDELKPAVRALITASCEGTEAGRRRALDRANEALVMGAKRRIEEYTLSLSIPSMLLFGIGILLPLMVGSFLPMLSWDLVGADVIRIGEGDVDRNRAILQTAIVMNIVFPTVALLVAADAVSKHPMAWTRGRGNGEGSQRVLVEILLALACAVAGVAVCATLADGPMEYVSCVVAAATPFAVLLMAHGSNPLAAVDHERRENIENLLFVAGARMVEGENFEAAVRNASVEAGVDAGEFIELWGNASGQAGRREGGSNEERALAVVAESAAKDESQAGILAMDLASYARDIAELEAVLKRRLKPTISMMRMTTHALAPIMLGVTHAIYVSLSSIGGGVADLTPGSLFIILAGFLMEINAVVAYFAWGISDRRSVGSLLYSIGACTLAAVSVMAIVVLSTS